MIIATPAKMVKRTATVLDRSSWTWVMAVLLL